MSDTLTTWRKLVLFEMECNHDDPDLLVGTAGDLDVEFDADAYKENGPPFTAWTADWVYFPVVYDGHESVGSVRRNPCEDPNGHVGGG